MEFSEYLTIDCRLWKRKCAKCKCHWWWPCSVNLYGNYNYVAPLAKWIYHHLYFDFFDNKLFSIFPRASNLIADFSVLILILLCCIRSKYYSYIFKSSSQFDCCYRLYYYSIFPTFCKSFIEIIPGDLLIRFWPHLIK